MTPRNHLIDLARALSVVVVVTFHCLLYQIVVTDGAPQVVPWAPQPHGAWWTASWFVMIIPLFFIAGGFAHALVIDRMRAQGRSYPHYLASRAVRLVGPLLLFVGFATVLSTAGAWLYSAPVSVALSVQFAQLLWFVAIYLVIVGIAPWMITLHDRWGVWPMLALTLLAGAVDAWSFTAGRPGLRYLNLLTVWPLCHQLGIAYYRGWFRRGPVWVPVTVAVAAAGLIPVLVFGLGYPASAIGLGDIPVANVLPPTVAMIVLGCGQVAVLGLLERAGVVRCLPAGVQRGLGVANALAVTTYLWHIPCIVIAAGALFGVSRLLPGATGVLLSQPVVALVTWLVIGAVIPLIGRAEYALIPRLDGDPGRAAVGAHLLLTAGTALVWLHGTVLHPDRPWSAVGLALLGAGMIWLTRAARTTAAPAR
ncbi:MAG: acyltransferase family protein [Micropruina sp.]|uniref:acyltransferase family protein n=1 Tax=Micropruina sp. TaxID=2737536 RepID=UPI0039E6480F